MADRRRLDQILQSRGQVSERQIQEALDQQSVLGGKLGEHLIGEGGVDEADLVQALSEQFELPGICLQGRTVDPALFKRLPLVVAEEHLCVPVGHNPADDTLEVAFANPTDCATLEAVSAAVRPSRVQPLVAAGAHIRSILSVHRRSLRYAGVHVSDSTDSPAEETHQQQERILDLLELALSSRDGGPDDFPERSVWVSRLAVEIAARLNQPLGVREAIRLAALASGIAAWRRTRSSSALRDTLAISASVLRYLDLPVAASLLERSIQPGESTTSPDLPSAILRAAWEIATVRPLGDTADAIELWEAQLSKTHRKTLDPSLIAVAFSVLRGRALRQRLAGPPAEIVVVGTGPFHEELSELLQHLRCRVVGAKSWGEVLALVERRCPDLLCVLTSTIRIPPNLVLEDQIGERGLGIGSVVFVVAREDSETDSALPVADSAGILNESMGAGVAAEYIQRVLRTTARPERRPRHDARRPAQPEPVVAGRLGDLSLADLVQLLSSGRKTIRAEFTRSDRRASLWFEQGQIVCAESGDLAGDGAFFDLLGWKEGRFEVHPAGRIDRRNITSQTTALLLEGFRRIDESRLAGGTLEIASFPQR